MRTVLIVAGVALCGFVLFGCGGGLNPNAQPAKPTGAAGDSVEVEPDAMARIFARKTIVKFLKYPDNAVIHADVHATEVDATHWSVVGKVDAMNAFGAKPTQPWRIDFEISGEGKDAQWNPVYVQLGDEVLRDAR